MNCCKEFSEIDKFSNYLQVEKTLGDIEVLSVGFDKRKMRIVSLVSFLGNEVKETLDVSFNYCPFCGSPNILRE